METIISEGRRVFVNRILNFVVVDRVVSQIVLNNLKNNNRRISIQSAFVKSFLLVCASLYLQYCLVLISKTTCTAVVSVMKKEQSHCFHVLTKIFRPNPTLPYK